MKAITNNKWIFLLLIFLVVSNVVLVVVLFSQQKPKQRQNTVKEFRKKLGLSHAQDSLFDARKDVFFKEMQPRWEEISHLKDSLYQHLKDENLPDSVISNYSNQWNRISNESDVALFKHFRELRNHITDSQRVIFDTLVPKMFINRGRRR
jgi:hypothetical protein